MTKPILDDELWALIEPLLPPHKVRHAYYLGRKPLNDRAVLTGILFIRRRDWLRQRHELLAQPVRLAATGVCGRLHEALLARLRAADLIDPPRVVVDSSSIRAVGSDQKPD